VSWITSVETFFMVFCSAFVCIAHFLCTDI
jgi:hypothetical protein